MTPAAPALPRKKLPIGIQNLREIREQDHYYVDKSGLAIDLLHSGKYFFLSRPRRFGKSLLVESCSRATGCCSRVWPT
jgi:hypothetical protein